MSRVLVAERADADTQVIVDDLAVKAGLKVATRYAAEFDRAYLRLEKFPEIGARRPQLGRHARIYLVLPYVVVHDYSRSDDLVTILRVLHGSRDIAQELLRSRSPGA